MLPPLRRVALATAALPLMLVAAGGVAPAAGSDLGTPPAFAGIDPVAAGLAGPVSAVLEDAPEDGPVALVVTSTDADGELSVAREVAPDVDEAADVVREARRDDATLSVSVERVYRALGSADPGRSTQWALDSLAAEQVWPRTTGYGVQVAVIDSGVDGNHPDLVGALGRGADFVEVGRSGRTDPNGHGTHVAGIIAARAGNGVGIAGLAPEATIMPVRVLDARGYGSSTTIADGVAWAVKNGADVLNLSLGSEDKDPALETALARARAEGVVVVAAVGNSGAPCTMTRRVDCDNPLLYPGASEGVVGVGATDSGNRRAPFSEHGPQVDVVAPGVGIASTYPRGRYVALEGTSMAAPHVAATVALLRSADPTLTRAEVEDRLTSTALDLGEPGFDEEFGHGLVQPVAAIGTARAPAATSTTVAVSAGNVRPGTIVTAGMTVTAAGRRVSGPAQLCVRRLTGSSPRCTAVAVNDGRASLRVTVPVGSEVTARFLGTATHRGSASAGVRVAVTPRVAAVGGKRRLTVQVSAAQRQRATVQRYRSGWRSVKAFTVTSGKRFAVTGLKAGTYRVTISASSELQASKSASVRVR